MKKPYEKPSLLCDEIRPESMLCSCDWINTAMNEEWHCAFDPDELGFALFLQTWENCWDHTGKFGNINVCVHGPEVHVFSS